MSYQIPPVTTTRRQFEFEVKRIADSLNFGGDPSSFRLRLCNMRSRGRMNRAIQ